jgi:hypothetical protein
VVVRSYIEELETKEIRWIREITIRRERDKIYPMYCHPSTKK